MIPFGLDFDAFSRKEKEQKPQEEQQAPPHGFEPLQQELEKKIHAPEDPLELYKQHLREEFKRLIGEIARDALSEDQVNALADIGVVRDEIVKVKEMLDQLKSAVESLKALEQTGMDSISLLTSLRTLLSGERETRKSKTFDKIMEIAELMLALDKLQEVLDRAKKSNGNADPNILRLERELREIRYMLETKMEGSRREEVLDPLTYIQKKLEEYDRLRDTIKSLAQLLGYKIKEGDTLDEIARYNPDIAEKLALANAEKQLAITLAIADLIRNIGNSIVAGLVAPVMDELGKEAKVFIKKMLRGLLEEEGATQEEAGTSIEQFKEFLKSRARKGGDTGTNIPIM